MSNSTTTSDWNLANDTGYGVNLAYWNESSVPLLPNYDDDDDDDVGNALQFSNGSAINSFIPGPMFQAVIYTMYTVIFVLALVGNMIVCAVVVTSIRKWTVTNFFIVNMAASDILMAFFCIPFTFVPTFVLLYWPFGAAMCRVVSFSQAVSVFVSAYTMVAISSDRYLAIVYPLRPRMTRKHAKWIIVAVWVAGVLTAMPILVLSELVMPKESAWHQQDERYICTEAWQDSRQQSQYTTVLLFLQYCFPLAVLVFTYGRIGVEIWGKKTPGEAHQHRDLRLARSKRKMIRMMIIVVFFFAFCWLPFNVLQIIGDQMPEIWMLPGINYVAFGCHWLAMSHSAYNPIIYCCFNSKFRQGFNGLATKCGCRRCLANDSSDRWQCDCGARLSGTQHSANGSANHADTHQHHHNDSTTLQRGNTVTTYTSNHSALAQRNVNNCAVAARLNHQRPLQRAGSNGHHHQATATQRNNGRGSPSTTSDVHCCRCAVLSPSHSGRGRRPQKFVFRANFTKPSTSKLLQHQHAQQHQLLLANSKPAEQRAAQLQSPVVRNTSVIVSINVVASCSATAESHM